VDPGELDTRRLMESAGQAFSAAIGAAGLAAMIGGVLAPPEQQQQQQQQQQPLGTDLGLSLSTPRRRGSLKRRASSPTTTAPA
jgi:hypothetical protein